MDLTVRAVASLFNVPEGRVYRWITEDDLPSREVNGQHCFNRTEVLEWATVRRVKFDPDLFRDPANGPVAGESLVAALQAGGVIPALGGSTKAEVLWEVVNRMRVPDGFDRTALYQLFLAREAAGSTAVGDGIAVPHPRHPVVLPVGRPTLMLCFLAQPVDFGASDGRPIHTLFVLVSPTIRVHLRILARIACALRDELLRGVLNRQGSQDEIVRELTRIERSYDRSLENDREHG
jgi:PTS system nitrogen regulatory IIA component